MCLTGFNQLVDLWNCARLAIVFWLVLHKVPKQSCLAPPVSPSVVRGYERHTVTEWESRFTYVTYPCFNTQLHVSVCVYMYMCVCVWWAAAGLSAGHTEQLVCLAGR